MQELRNWTAKRAGGRITISGVTPDGAPMKVAGIDNIAPGKTSDALNGAGVLCPVATHHTGTQYRLG